jgi:hypothetical protein
MYSLDIKNLFLFQKNRCLGSDLKNYLGIQYGTFLLRKKKIILLYVCRVVLVPFSEKKSHPLLHQIICPPYQFPHKKWQREAAELFGRRRQGGGDGNVRALAAAHLWTSVAAAAAAVAGGGDVACFT